MLAWESDEYIGQGNVSVFSTDSPGSGTITRYNDSEVTVLVRHTSNTPGGLMIESLLQLTVNVYTSTYPNFTITCHNSDLGMRNSVTYHTTSK